MNMCCTSKDRNYCLMHLRTSVHIVSLAIAMSFILLIIEIQDKWIVIVIILLLKISSRIILLGRVHSKLFLSGKALFWLCMAFQHVSVLLSFYYSCECVCFPDRVSPSDGDSVVSDHSSERESTEENLRSHTTPSDSKQTRKIPINVLNGKWPWQHSHHPPKHKDSAYEERGQWGNWRN